MIEEPTATETNSSEEARAALTEGVLAALAAVDRTEADRLKTIVDLMLDYCRATNRRLDALQDGLEALSALVHASIAMSYGPGTIFAPPSGFIAPSVTDRPPSYLPEKTSIGHRAGEPPPDRQLTVNLGLLNWRTVVKIRDDLMRLRDASLAPIVDELSAHLREGPRR
jgi:hypothetical protein